MWRGPIVVPTRVTPRSWGGLDAVLAPGHRKAERALRREDQAARPACAKRMAPRTSAAFLAAVHHAVGGCVLRARLRSLAWGLARGLAWKLARELAAELKSLQALPQWRRRGRRHVRRGE